MVACPPPNKTLGRVSVEINGHWCTFESSKDIPVELAKDLTDMMSNLITDPDVKLHPPEEDRP